MEKFNKTSLPEKEDCCKHLHVDDITNAEFNDFENSLRSVKILKKQINTSTKKSYTSNYELERALPEQKK